MREGYVDTNVFLHAQARDAHTTACRELLRTAAAGRVEPLVLHELTYILPRYVKTMQRADVALIAGRYCSGPASKWATPRFGYPSWKPGKLMTVSVGRMRSSSVVRRTPASPSGAATRGILAVMPCRRVRGRTRRNNEGAKSSLIQHLTGGS